MLKILERPHVRPESLAVLLALIVVMAILSPVTGSGVRVFLTANNFFNIILNLSFTSFELFEKNMKIGKSENLEEKTTTFST